MKNVEEKDDLIAQASIKIKRPRPEVWDALVNPDAIKKYMFGTEVITDWKKGSSIIWKGEWKGKPYNDKGAVMQIEPQMLLQYSHFSPLSGEEDIPENYHIVTIVLTEEDDGVMVSLSQDKNPTEESLKHSEQNWNTMMKGLKEYVESKEGLS